MERGQQFFVWTAGTPLSNMQAVLERRCLEGRMQGLEENAHPPLNAAYSALLVDVAAFLDGDVDVQRMADLALPLSFVSYRARSQPSEFQQNTPFNISAAYAAMKLTLLPGKFFWPQFDVEVKIQMEPQMLVMLRAGRVREAYRVACRRLWASGLKPLSDESGIADRSDYGRRLAAALLFPIDRSAHSALAERALWKPRATESQDS